MKLKTVFLLTLGLILIVAAAAISCSGSPTASPSPSPSPTATTGLDVSAIRAYADPATTTTMQGLSESNLAKYVQYGNPAFKAAMTQAIVDQTAAQVGAQLGTFVSAEFLRVEEQDGYNLAHYKAKYTRGEVGVRMVFDKNRLVAGQWFE